MTLSATRPLTIAVIGDVHNQWSAIDSLALRHLGVDLALFVGDFGNEDLEVVGAIASLDIPLAAALGNHDAWYTATDWGRKKCPYDRRREDRVQQQLDLLGVAHVGYSYRNFTELSLSVIGGRPFSWGGSEWKYSEFYQQRFGVGSFAESTQRIVTAGQESGHDTLIVLSHNGPFGLGDEPEAPCGRDWQPLGGDHGDPDLEMAIATLKTAGKKIPLVAFGHMHHQLRHTRTRQRTAVTVIDHTLYLNAACVPRMISTLEGSQHYFCLVSWQDNSVSEITSLWLNQELQTVSRQLLYSQTHLGEDGDQTPLLAGDFLNEIASSPPL